jgi:hypothetical protein
MLVFLVVTILVLPFALAGWLAGWELLDADRRAFAATPDLAPVTIRARR